jgi:hypothetical protein
MKYFSIILLLTFVTDNLYSQKANDNVIAVTVDDTSNLYQRVRQAITYTDLIIREDAKHDTLITYSERIHGSTILLLPKLLLLEIRLK